MPKSVCLTVCLSVSSPRGLKIFNIVRFKMVLDLEYDASLYVDILPWVPLISCVRVLMAIGI